MKNFVLYLLCLGVPAAVSAQSADHKWNVGIHGGASQYNGELGNGWYSFNQAFYGHAGISVSRYLSRNFDVSVMGTRGELGHVDHNAAYIEDGVRNNFLVRLTTANAFLRYFPLGRTQIVQPYLVAGAGILLQRGLGNTTYSNKQPFDISAGALGAGVQFPLGNYLAIQLQETFIHTSADRVDAKEGGINDLYLLHTLGLTVNLAKFWQNSGPGGGAGENIDKCMKMPKDRVAKKQRTNNSRTKSRNKSKSAR